MALPVHQIMAQLQEGVNAKGAEAEEKGELHFVFFVGGYILVACLHRRCSSSRNSLRGMI